MLVKNVKNSKWTSPRSNKDLNLNLILCKPWGSDLKMSINSISCYFEVLCKQKDLFCLHW
jgi:hypothetical protein